jgi:fatty acid desaturase
MQQGSFILERETFRKLNRVNSLQNIVHGILVLGLYMFLSGLGYRMGSIWLWIPIWIYQGFILSGFLGASHDCAHNTFSSSRRFNRIAGIFWSSTVLFNFSLYKYYHLNHHRHTHVPGDTEPYGSFGSIWDYIRTLPMTGFFFPFWKMSFLAHFNWYPTFIKNRKQRNQVVQDNWGLWIWLCACIILTIFYPMLLLKCYWIPMVVYTSIPEHYDCEEGTDVTKNTRTLESNWLFKYIFWNGNYHAEHHLFPSVPSHNLGKLHKLVGEQFKVRESSYLKFHIKMIKGILRHKRDSSNIVFTPEERIIYKFYKPNN